MQNFQSQRTRISFDLELLLVAAGVDVLLHPARGTAAPAPGVVRIFGIAVADFSRLCTEITSLFRGQQQREQIYVQLLGLCHDPLLELLDGFGAKRGEPGVELSALLEEAGVVGR